MCALFFLPCHWVQLRRAWHHLLYCPPQVPIHTDLVPPRLLFTPAFPASLRMTWKSDSTITKKTTFDWMMPSKGVNNNIKPKRGTISQHLFHRASYHMPAEAEPVWDALINWPQFPFSQWQGCVPAAQTTMQQPTATRRAGRLQLSADRALLTHGRSCSHRLVSTAKVCWADVWTGQKAATGKVRY